MKGAVARKFIGEDRYIDLPRLAVRAHRRIRGGNTVHRRALDRRGGQIGVAADRLQHRRDIGVHVAAIASGRKLRLPAIAADADLGPAGLHAIAVRYGESEAEVGVEELPPPHTPLTRRVALMNAAPHA